jgi:hypothetical protein
MGGLSRSASLPRFIWVSCGVKLQQVDFVEAAISLKVEVSPRFRRGLVKKIGFSFVPIKS